MPINFQIDANPKIFSARFVWLTICENSQVSHRVYRVYRVCALHQMRSLQIPLYASVMYIMCYKVAPKCLKMPTRCDVEVARNSCT